MLREAGSHFEVLVDIRWTSRQDNGLGEGGYEEYLVAAGGGPSPGKDPIEGI